MLPRRGRTGMTTYALNLGNKKSGKRIQITYPENEKALSEFTSGAMAKKRKYIKI